VDREALRVLLGQGLSLESIGRRYGKDASTVGYWVRKHGLRAVNADRHAPRGGISKAQLEPLVQQGMSMREIADRLGFSLSTVRHWMRRHGLRTERTVRLAASEDARAAGAASLSFSCRHHGVTEFRATSRGWFRCAKCSAEAVSRRRRRVKELLVEEAGGRCRICGYDRHPGALHFHHLDPEEKAFHLSLGGQTRSLAKVREEAAKCVLLCSNCHAEVEAGIVQVDRERGGE
jgi:transposase